MYMSSWMNGELIMFSACSYSTKSNSQVVGDTENKNEADIVRVLSCYRSLKKCLVMCKHYVCVVLISTIYLSISERFRTSSDNEV
jgi:hypothetical protein